MRLNALILMVFIAFGGVLAAPWAASAQDYDASQTEERQDQAFLSAMGDIPLMDGLQELTQDTLVFDKPGGRIVQVTAVGKGVSADAIAQFYRKTLPQLGWRRVSPNMFVRDGEVLEIGTVDSGDYGSIHFSVKPQ